MLSRRLRSLAAYEDQVRVFLSVTNFLSRKGVAIPKEIFILAQQRADQLYAKRGKRTSCQVGPDSLLLLNEMARSYGLSPPLVASPGVLLALKKLLPPAEEAPDTTLEEVLRVRLSLCTRPSST